MDTYGYGRARNPTGDNALQRNLLQGIILMSWLPGLDDLRTFPIELPRIPREDLTAMGEERFRLLFQLKLVIGPVDRIDLFPDRIRDLRERLESGIDEVRERIRGPFRGLFLLERW